MKLLPLLFAITSLFSEQTAISSDEASFISDLLTLQGNVSISHPLGHFVADKVILEKMENVKDNRLSRAIFENRVKIALSDNRYMECDTADFNFTLLKGFLTGKDDHLVTISDKQGDLTLLLKAKNISCTFSNEGGKNFQSLLGENLVELNIGDLYHIMADKVEYLPDGFIKFSSHCSLQTPKETLFASHISYNKINNTFSFYDLEGVTNNCKIQAKHSTFSKNDRKILFDQGVLLEPENLGIIRTKGLIEIILDEEDKISKINNFNDPIEFSNDLLTLESSNINLDYSLDGLLTHLSFLNHVKITPRSSALPLKYATANVLKYDHNEGLFVMLGSEEEPIMLTKNNLTMNGEKFTITFDKETHKSEIKADGTVYLSFPLHPNWKEDLPSIIRDINE